MSKTYEIAEDEVQDLVERTIWKYHKALETAGVTVRVIMVESTEGPAIKHHGAPALAVIKINNLQNRLLGTPDATIEVDRSIWDGRLDELKRIALMDHELTHLLVQYHDSGAIKRDGAGRPKLKMKEHDYQFGWFIDVAKRHRMNSPEVVQAQMLMEENGQTFWPGLLDDATHPARAADLDRRVDEHLKDHADALKGAVGKLADMAESVTISSGGKSVTIPGGAAKKRAKSKADKA